MRSGSASSSLARARCASRSASRAGQKTAKLRHLAAVEDVDYRTPRGLDRTAFLKLAGCDWIFIGIRSLRIVQPSASALASAAWASQYSGVHGSAIPPG